MQRFYRTFLASFFVLVPTLHLQANHIVGGEIAIRRVSPGSNVHELTLTQFWNENNLVIGSATVAGNRDNTARIFVYRKSDGVLMDSVMVTYRDVRSVSYQNQSCATSRSLKTLQGIYTGAISLSPAQYDDAGGYYVLWERCCRNDDINNIRSPGDNGMVFYLEFPRVTVPNSSPRFQFPNGQYICANQPFTMGMAAIDDDGDELRYSLVTPLRGNTTPDAPLGNSTPKTGYPLVTWGAGFSENNAINGTVPLTINPFTGMLTVMANQLGLHVFTVLCEEFRNGQRIGLVRRDFQLLVVDCSTETPEAPVVTMQAQTVSEVKLCPGQTTTLETEGSVDWAYQWQLNGLNVAGATTSQLMVQDTGTYVVVKSFITKCSRDTASLPVRVSYSDPVPAELTADRTLLCPGDSVVLLANAGMAVPSGASYIWLRDGSEITRDVSYLSVSGSGVYQLEIQYPRAGCPGRDTLIIAEESVSVDLPDQLNIQRGNAVTISALPAPAAGAYTYSWLPADNSFRSAADNATVVVAPQDSTVYVVRLETLNGCVATDTVLVRVFDRMYIPDAFSPNGDGRNDHFEILNVKDQLVEIQIYNRWGEVVFWSDNYERPWDGTFRKQPAPPGYYPYRIRTIYGDVRGEVLLIR